MLQSLVVQMFSGRGASWPPLSRMIIRISYHEQIQLHSPFQAAWTWRLAHLSQNSKGICHNCIVSALPVDCDDMQCAEETMSQS